MSIRSRGGLPHLASFDDEWHLIPAIILDVENAKSKRWGLAVGGNPLIVEVSTLTIASGVLTQNRVCLLQGLYTSEQFHLFVPVDTALAV